MERYNDHRAGHRVYVHEGGTCVKFQWAGYTISLAADGQETIVLNQEGENVEDFIGTGADSVAAAFVFIASLKG